MANNIYDIAKQGFLTGVSIGGTETQINWVNDDFSVALLDNNNPSFDRSHQYMTEFSFSVIARAELVTSVIELDGTAYAETVNFTVTDNNLPDDGTIAQALVVYRENNKGGTLDDSENVLIAYIETAENLPLILNGGDVTVQWDLSAQNTGRVFKL